jgi:phospholipid-translocating ATPase
MFAPDDIDIMRWARKVDKNRDFAKEAHQGGMMRLQPQTGSRSGSASRRTTFEGERATRGTPSLRNASRTDMSTGVRSVHRGFDFATEESGPAMRRLQSNLSGATPSQQLIPTPERKKRNFTLTSIARGLTKKRRPRTNSSGTDQS